MKRPFRPPVLSRVALSAVLLGIGLSPVLGQSPGNPFKPPRAKVFYAPDRDYDLKHLAVTLDVDWPGRTFAGTTVNTLVPIRAEGLASFKFHCGRDLNVSACEVNGSPATFERKDNLLTVTPRVRRMFVPGQEVTVAIRYTGGKAQGSGFGGDGGFHWIETRPDDPNRVGFWTQGETAGNQQWAPTWDYPNDFATTETTTTVPADWSVIGNGVKLSDKVSGNRRTVHWKMNQPHATYLLSLVAGPFDIKEAKWEGKPLLYVVPKGKGGLIDTSFGDTPDMLSFFSRITGVKYPWPKYAQNAMYDFGGGMENVSSTTLGANSLTDGRDGFRTMAALNSHELAHQWFGDLVTCRDWGNIWLNESFATYFEALYFEHSRGKNGYDREIEGAMQGYFGEARRYQRPVATNLYPHPDSLFDSHTYPKGAAILHTLRRQLGDSAFFQGIQLYLTKGRHTPVETSDLIRALTDASGVNVQPFFDQWIFKPGHPVLEYAWTYDDGAGELTVTVKQVQDTKDGAPVYNLPTEIGVLSGGKWERFPVTLNASEQKITRKAARPDAVILDPDHAFLREMKHTFAASELPGVVRYAPNCIDRQTALNAMLKESPSEESVRIAAAAIAEDRGAFPAFTNIMPLANLKREDLRPLFRNELKHPDSDRQAQAVRALAMLPKTEEDSRAIRSMIGPKAPYAVYSAALGAILRWEQQEGGTLLAQALKDPNERMRSTGIRAIVGLPEGDPEARRILKECLRSSEMGVLFAALDVIVERKEKDLLSDLRTLGKTPPAGTPGWFPGAVASYVRRLESVDSTPPDSK
ncbi:MAG: M1 family metallopeptidase [Capsulimonadales bacterium]|nr:M1 family metallopeptidase [Capsulimonadales bacterium]